VIAGRGLKEEARRRGTVVAGAGAGKEEAARAKLPAPTGSRVI